MQKCATCGQKFSYKQLIESVIKNYKPIRCTKCHQTYTTTIISRLLLSFLLVGLIFVNFPLNQPMYVKLLVVILIGALLLFISPFIIRYKKVVDEDE